MANSAMLIVGTPPETVEVLGLVIMAILTAPCEDKTKRVALETLKTASSVDHTTISNCHFDGAS